MVASTSRVFLVAVTRVRFPFDKLCTDTRAGAGGRRNDAAEAIGVAFLYVVQSDVTVRVGVVAPGGGGGGGVAALTATDAGLAPMLFTARTTNE